MTLSIRELQKQEEEATSRINKEIMQQWLWYALTYGVSFTGCLKISKADLGINVDWWDKDKKYHEETIHADRIYQEPVYEQFLIWAGYRGEVIISDVLDKEGNPKKDRKGNIKRKVEGFKAHEKPAMYSNTAERNSDAPNLIDQLIHFITEVYPREYDPETMDYTDKIISSREKYRHIETADQKRKLRIIAEIIIGRRIMEAIYANDAFADPEIKLAISYNYGMHYKRDEIVALIRSIIDASADLLSPPQEKDEELAKDIINGLSEKLPDIVRGLSFDKDNKLIMQSEAQEVIGKVVLDKITSARKTELAQLSQQIVNGLFGLWQLIDEKAKPTPEIIEEILAKKYLSGERFRLLKNRTEEVTEEVKREEIGRTIELGQLFLKAKEQLPPEDFRKLLRTGTEDMAMTAIYDAMNIAKAFGDNPQVIEGLSYSAIKALAAPSTPPEQTSEQVIERTQSGKPLTFDVIKKALEDARRSFLGNE